MEILVSGRYIQQTNKACGVVVNESVSSLFAELKLPEEYRVIRETKRKPDEEMSQTLQRE